MNAPFPKCLPRFCWQCGAGLRCINHAAEHAKPLGAQSGGEVKRIAFADGEAERARFWLQCCANQRRECLRIPRRRAHIRKTACAGLSG